MYTFDRRKPAVVIILIIMFLNIQLMHFAIEHILQGNTQHHRQSKYNVQYQCKAANRPYYYYYYYYFLFTWQSNTN